MVSLSKCGALKKIILFLIDSHAMCQVYAYILEVCMRMLKLFDDMFALLLDILIGIDNEQSGIYSITLELDCLNAKLPKNCNCDLVPNNFPLLSGAITLLGYTGLVPFE